MFYFISDLCFSFSGSADLLYVESKDSGNNLTSHFLVLLPVIIIQDNRKELSTHSVFEFKLVVKENTHLKRKRKDVLLTQTLLSFELIFDTCMIVDCASRNMCFIPTFACVSGVVWNTECGEKNGESTGKLGLKMTNRTRTEERKMVQLYYFVSGCVISMLIFYRSR